MPREPEGPLQPPAVLLRALLYAGTITLILLFAGEEPPRFIYMAF